MVNIHISLFIFLFFLSLFLSQNKTSSLSLLKLLSVPTLSFSSLTRGIPAHSLTHARILKTEPQSPLLQTHTSPPLYLSLPLSLSSYEDMIRALAELQRERGRESCQREQKRTGQRKNTDFSSHIIPYYFASSLPLDSSNPLRKPHIIHTLSFSTKPTPNPHQLAESQNHFLLPS